MRGQFGVRGICLTLGLLAVLLGAARAADQDDPILTLVKSRLKNPDQPFTLVVRLRAKEGAGDRLEAAFAKSSKATHQEKGNLIYQLNRDTQEPTHYLVYERWQSLAALQSHLQTAHVKTLLGELPQLTEGAPEFHVLLPTGE